MYYTTARRADALISNNDLKEIREAASKIKEDLRKDGFEDQDIKAYLYNIIDSTI